MAGPYWTALMEAGTLLGRTPTVRWAEPKQPDLADKVKAGSTVQAEPGG